MSQNALLDFLQAASNSAASTVSGPVDLIAAGLRTAGVPVPRNAFLSSEWMAQQGLTKQPQNALMRVAGETAGMVAPTAIAAKAPQVANALLQAWANMAAPRAMGPAAAQRGAIVWHGSPHKFDAFDSSKIGTGEGAQAYGHGIYFAETPEVAATYRTAGSDAQYSRFTGGLTPMEEYAFDRAAAGASGDNLFSQVWSRYGKNIKSDAEMDALAAAVRKAEQGAGSLYKVDLPDEKIARMLDWDKPLSQQAQAMEALKRTEWIPATEQRLPQMTGAELYRAMSNRDGSRVFIGDQSFTADYLRKQGIPGIRYLDGGSRGAGSGTSNFVVFPGEESALRILERNGKPLGR